MDLEIATLISAFLGPLIGVCIAWSLNRSDQHKDAAYKFFVKLAYDLQAYQAATSDLHTALHLPQQYEGFVPLLSEAKKEHAHRRGELTSNIVLCELLFGRKGHRLGNMLTTMSAKLTACLSNPDKTAMHAQQLRSAQQIVKELIQMRNSLRHMDYDLD